MEKIQCVSIFPRVEIRNEWVKFSPRNCVRGGCVMSRVGPGVVENTAPGSYLTKERKNMGNTPNIVIAKLSVVTTACQATVLGLCEQTYGPLSEREKEMVLRSAYSATSATLNTLPYFYRKFKDDPDIKAWWDEEKLNREVV